MAQSSPVGLLFPLGISIILAAFYKVFVGKRPEKARPQEVYYQPNQPYQQGYQTHQPRPTRPKSGSIYQEAGQQFSFEPLTFEQPEAQYPNQKMK